MLMQAQSEEQFLMKTSTTLAKPLKYFIIAAIWLAVWQGVSMLINEEILFVSPLKVLLELFRMSSESEFWLTLLSSIGRVVGGFAIGFVIAAVLAVLAFRFPFIKAFLSPAISVIKATPVASFIILALMWLGNSTVPIIISMLMVIPIVWSNTVAGLDNVDSNLIEMAVCYKMPFSKRLRHIYIPSVMPYLMSATGSGLGLCWKAGIAAEVICRTKLSIGNNIWETKFYLETTQMFAWTAAVIVLSVIFDAVIRYVFKRVTARYNTEVSE